MSSSTGLQEVWLLVILMVEFKVLVKVRTVQKVFDDSVVSPVTSNVSFQKKLG